MKCSEHREVGGDIGISWLRREAQNEENTVIKSKENKNERQEIKKKIHRHYNEYYNITIIILTLRNLKIL